MPMTKDEKRCWHTTIDGRRCRMERMETHPELCFYHWQQQEELAEALKNSMQIVSPRAKLSTARGINRVLGNILKAHAQGKIPARSAATMSYTCQLLLLSLPYLIKERAAEAEKKEKEKLPEAPKVPLDPFDPATQQILDAVFGKGQARVASLEEQAVLGVLCKPQPSEDERHGQSQSGIISAKTLEALDRINAELQGRNRNEEATPIEEQPAAQSKAKAR